MRSAPGKAVIEWRPPKSSEVQLTQRPFVNSRERVAATLVHNEPDKIPFDLGGSAVTGIHASTLYRLRQRLGLDPPCTHVKANELCQMLGEIAPGLCPCPMEAFFTHVEYVT